MVFFSNIDNQICAAFDKKNSHAPVAARVPCLPQGNLRAALPVMHQEVIYSESFLFLTNTVYISSPAVRIIAEQISGQGFDWLSLTYPEQCSEKQDSQWVFGPDWWLVVVGGL